MQMLKGCTCLQPALSRRQSGRAFQLSSKGWPASLTYRKQFHFDQVKHHRICHRSPVQATAALGHALGSDAARPAGKIFIFGLGYVGVALAAEMRRQGWHVSGTCRDEEACGNFRAEGVDAHVLDTDNEQHLSSDARRSLASACHIVSTVPPAADFDQDPVLLACKSLLVEVAHTVSWVGYVSSTGVYGDYQGDWVDESSVTRADSGKNLARLRAEQAWMALHVEHGLPLHIFRLGGIYGPRRSALEAAQQKSASESQERRGGQRFTARCHVHDICSVMQASMQRPRPGAVYNVVDDVPAPRSEVLHYARQLLALADGNAKAMDDSPASRAELPTRSGLAEKRVSNQLIKQELGVQLRFPSYREGLVAIAQKDRTPFLV